MTGEEREQWVKEFRARYEDSVMAAKGPEYSGTGRGETEDVNGNFKRVGTLLGLEPKTVAAVYFLKHIDSIVTYIRTGQAGSEPIEGRLGDAVNYLKIIGTLITEEQVGTPKVS